MEYEIDEQRKNGEYTAQGFFLSPTKRYGGIERTLVTLAQELVDRGVEVRLAMLRNGEVPYSAEMPESVRLHRLRTGSKLSAIPAVIRLIRQHRPDAVITTNDHSAQVAVLARLLGRLNTKVYLTITGMWSSMIKRRLQRLMIKLTYPKADRIIAVSYGTADDLCESFAIPKEMVSVIYNPVITRDFHSRTERKPDHPWFQSGEVIPIILAASRLSPEKGLPSLLHAFHIVQREIPCRLLILGEGSERDKLEREVEQLGLQDRVDLPGYISDPLPYMAHAQIFAFPSLREGFGIALAEALAAGAQVVSTDCPNGPYEILEGGQHGILVPVGDTRELAAALQELLTGQRRFRASASALQRFEAGRIAEAYMELIYR